ncbi:MAG: hypothetical protein ABIW30_00845 [Arenimonas sp.]
MLAIALAATVPAARAETLLVDRIKITRAMSLPHRGDAMARVVSLFGQPQSRVAAVGGASRRTPPISRWIYPGFTVYFENSHVVDAVVNKADPLEIGPSPVGH